MKGFEQKEPSAYDQEKTEKMREIFEVPPDAIFVLSAGIIPRETKEKPGKEQKTLKTPEGETLYKTTAYSDLDPRGFLGGGKARIIATAEAHKAFPETPIVTDSYTPKERLEGKPTHAEVMAQELKRYGVDETIIMKEEKSVDTFTELIEMIKMAAEKNWRTIAILSNEYQLPRIRAMYENIDTLVLQRDPDFEKNDPEFYAAMEQVSKNGLDIHYVSSEDILPLRSERYSPLIEGVEQTEEFKKRVAAEEHGMEDLKEGRYFKKK